MNFTIISYLITFLLPVIGGVIGYFKLKRKHRKELEDKNELIHSLQTTVREMVILNGEKVKVEKQSKQTKKDISNMSDDDLNINYSNKLPNMPRKSRSRNKKI